MDTFKATDYLAPRHWPTWLGLTLLRMMTWLPYGWQLTLGKGLGRLMYRLVSSRRRVAQINIALCFPELSAEQRKILVRRSFDSLGISVFEAGLAWWGSNRRLRKLYRVEGLEHVRQALEAGKGVLVLGAHYTTLELGGRLIGFDVRSVYPIYKRARNRLFDAIMTAARGRIYDGLLVNTGMRGIVKTIKENKIAWYAPDQDFGRKRSVFAPFMGVQTATLTTTARIAQLSGAPVLPFYSERLSGKQGYLLRILPPLEGFPSGDDVADATRINQVIETQVRRAPEQYLWVHKRFKTRPEGEPDLYAPD